MQKPIIIGEKIICILFDSGGDDAKSIVKEDIETLKI
jgi:hypothetical protein